MGSRVVGRLDCDNMELAVIERLGTGNGRLPAEAGGVLRSDAVDEVIADSVDAPNTLELVTPDAMILDSEG